MGHPWMDEFLLCLPLYVENGRLQITNHKGFKLRDENTIVARATGLSTVPRPVVGPTALSNSAYGRISFATWVSSPSRVPQTRPSKMVLHPLLSAPSTLLRLYSSLILSLLVLRNCPSLWPIEQPQISPSDSGLRKCHPKWCISNFKVFFSSYQVVKTSEMDFESFASVAGHRRVLTLIPHNIECVVGWSTSHCQSPLFFKYMSLSALRHSSFSWDITFFSLQNFCHQK